MESHDLIRKAIPGDEHAVLDLIKELATYEKEPDAVINTTNQLAVDLFEDKVCDCFVYIHQSKIIGIALYYLSYSTWKGRCIYLEDIYVQPDFRRLGAGSKLFKKVVNEAKRIGVRRMDWQVLEWNELALNFYKKVGAHLDNEWVNGRLFFE